MPILDKTIAGAVAAAGMLALLTVLVGSLRDASEPAALPAAAPLSEQPKAPAKAPTFDAAPAPAAAATSAPAAPKAVEPKAIAAPAAVEAKPQPVSPKPAPVPVNSAGADRDCPDFGSQGEAQRFFLANGGPSSDPHRLDRDDDGIACESN